MVSRLYREAFEAMQLEFSILNHQLELTTYRRRNVLD